MSVPLLCLILAAACFAVSLIARAVYQPQAGPARIDWIAAGLFFLTLALIFAPR